MFEHRTHPMLPWSRFLLRLMRTALIAGGIVLGGLGIGTLGYHHFERLSWLDAALNAAMILTGMGPVTPVQTRGGKVFAIFYALFAGVVFLTIAAVLFAPVAHRMIHRLHLQLTEDEEPRRPHRKG